MAEQSHFYAGAESQASEIAIKTTRAIKKRAQRRKHRIKSHAVLDEKSSDCVKVYIFQHTHYSAVMK